MVGHDKLRAVNPLELRLLGNTGLRVTALGFGGATLGNIREAVPEQRAEATIRAALEGGVNFFDTAPWYGLGLSEYRFGNALSSAARESFVLSTKVGRLLQRGQSPEYRHPAWPLGLGFEPRFDYSQDGILRSYHDSLARLGLNRVDALVVHDLDFLYHSEEAGVLRCFEQLDAGRGFETLMALQKRGEIRAIGAGINMLGFIPRFLDRFEVDFFIVAMPYTLLDQDGLEELEPCRRRGVSVVIGAPFASGVLAGGSTYNYGPVPQEVAARAAKIRAVCERFDVPVGAAALQFVLAHPAVASVIAGPGSPEEARQNLEWVRQPIPGELWRAMVSDGAIRAGAPVPA